MSQAPNEVEFLMEVSKVKKTSKVRETVDLTVEKQEFYHPSKPEPKPKQKQNLTKEERIEEAKHQCQSWWDIVTSLKNVNEFMQLKQKENTKWTPIEGDVIKEIYYDEKQNRYKTMVKRRNGLDLLVMPSKRYNNEIYKYLIERRQEADKKFDIWSLYWGILHGKDENWAELKRLMGESD